MISDVSSVEYRLMSSPLFIVSVTGSNRHTHIHSQTKSDGGTPAATHADTHARAAGVKQPGMRVESSHGDVWNPEWVRKDREKEKQGEGPEGSSLYFVRDRGKQSIWPPSSPRGHFLIAPVPNPDDEGA